MIRIEASKMRCVSYVTGCTQTERIINGNIRVEVNIRSLSEDTGNDGTDGCNTSA